MADLSSLIIDGVTYDIKDTVARQGSSDDFVGATSSTAGTHGLVPAPSAGDQGKFLKGDGTWAAASGSSDMITDEYNSSTTYGPLKNSNNYPSFCISGNILYRNLVACTNVAPPNNTYWVATSVADEITSLNSNSTSWSSLNITSYIANYSSGEGVIYKYGSLCILALGNLVLSATTNDNFNSSAFPSAYRPTDPIFATIIDTNNATYRIWSRTSGIFGCNTLPANIRLFGQLVYHL